MKIKAKFIGTDSLGYKHNQDYILNIREQGSMTIKRESGLGVCKYNSLSAFLRNWNLIVKL
jgi:hypothetical protein